jgi:8-oxo-dGTP pyrophosphatase MutT (NUDIX family)
MAAAIPEFGRPAPGVEYVLRPGGYAIIFSDSGHVAAVSTPLGVALPGGGQQDGEPPEEAAVREVEEECGLRVMLGARIAVADELVFAADEQTHYRKRCTFFLAQIIGRHGGSELDHELVWLSPQDASTMLPHESQRWAVAEACRRKTLMQGRAAPRRPRRRRSDLCGSPHVPRVIRGSKRRGSCAASLANRAASRVLAAQ